MPADDTHRVKLQQLIASLKAWSGFVADVAKVEVTEIGQAWRILLQPKAASACPMEMLLDGGSTRCDLRIAGETYEDWPLPSLDIVLPLIEAVAEGRVVTRYTSSAATGLPLSVATVISLADGRHLETSLDRPGHRAPAADAVQIRDTHYLPYRRADVRIPEQFKLAGRQ
jgi:hypothetical protein